MAIPLGQPVMYIIMSILRYKCHCLGIESMNTHFYHKEYKIDQCNFKTMTI